MIKYDRCSEELKAINNRLVVDKRKRWFLTLETVHFVDDYTKYETDADIVFFMQSKNGPSNVKEFYTLYINLRKSEAELYSELNKTTKKGLKKIRLNDNIQYSLNSEPTYYDICDFHSFYHSFCLERALKPVSIRDIQKYSDVGALVITRVTDLDRGILNYSCYIRDDVCVRGWLTSSHPRNCGDASLRQLISQANRYEVWQSINEFKRLGLSIFDYGGLTLQQEDIRMSNIDSTKKGFGGEVVKKYNFRFGYTFIGKIALVYYNLRYKASKAKNRR